MKYTEGMAVIETKIAKIPTKDMGVFYNPVMKFNRDFTIALLKSVPDKKMKISDPMAASGVRSIRMEKEAGGKIFSIDANDMSKAAYRQILKNVKANRCKKINVMNIDWNSNKKKYDYIDIDPFGYPGPFIKNAIECVNKGGILAVTATDTAALTGSAPKACMRKYLARNSRCWFMHEIGLRILIGWVAKKISVEVLASYSRDHYMRAFFRIRKAKMPLGYIWRCENCLEFGKGKKKKCSCANEPSNSGPLWLGNLGNPKLLRKMREYLPKEKFLDYMQSDYESKTIGFHDIHEICSKNKLSVPSFEKIMRNSGAKRTHFSKTGIKSAKSVKKLTESINSSLFIPQN